VDAGRRSGLHYRERGVREGSVQLCRKREVRIGAGGHPAPFFRHGRFDMAVKRGVDLDQIEKLRQVSNSAVRFQGRRIDGSLPIPIRPARHTNLDVAACVH